MLLFSLLVLCRIVDRSLILEKILHGSVPRINAIFALYLILNALSSLSQLGLYVSTVFCCRVRREELNVARNIFGYILCLLMSQFNKQLKCWVTGITHVSLKLFK